MTDIKTLNDNLRKHLVGGKIILTQGMEAKTYEEIASHNGSFSRLVGKCPDR